MDDTRKRQITEETLNEVLNSINPVILSTLPVDPREILPYATRRTEPVISKNINEDLAKKMMKNRLSDVDYLSTLFLSISDSFANKASSLTPIATILVAQTGAGKTGLRTALLQRNPNTIIINSDLYKKFRPDTEKLLKKDPTHFGALTGIDSYDHANNIIDFATSHSYNILIESAPSLQQGLPGVDIEKMKNMGYNIQFHIMAVGDLVSALAIHLRYERELISKKTAGDAKLTDLKRHNESYMAVENIIKTLDSDSITIYRRGTIKEMQIPMQIYMPGTSPLQILQDVRDSSNEKYIEDGFEEDYKLISESMEHRNAPEEQIKQLNAIHSMYLAQLTQQKEKRRQSQTQDLLNQDTSNPGASDQDAPDLE